jgi:hypothetical protein
MGRGNRTVAAVVAAACLSACAASQPSMEIRADRNPAATFASYATYAWAKPPLQAPQWPTQDDRVSFDWQVRGLVDQQMARLGYRQVAAAQADLLLDYGVAVREETMSDSFGAYAKYRAEGGSESAGTAWVMGYERGTLTVDATDRRLRSLVWYGEASAVVNPSLRAERLPKAITEIFAKFPPRTAP